MDRASEYRAFAQQLRDDAAASKIPTLQLEMLRLAKQFDKLADDVLLLEPILPKASGAEG